MFENLHADALVFSDALVEDEALFAGVLALSVVLEEVVFFAYVVKTFGDD